MVWSTQEGEGRQTLRVCPMSVTHFHWGLPQAAWWSVVDVVTFTHQALAASGSGQVWLEPSEKGYGLGFLLHSPSDIVTEPAGCCHLGTSWLLSSASVAVPHLLLLSCLRLFLPMPQRSGHNQPFLLSPSGLCLVPC